MDPIELHYSSIVRWSDEDGEFVAVVPELPGISGLGATPAEALDEAHEAATAALEVLAEDGVEPPAASVLRPYSGQLRVRMPRSLHRRLAELAEVEGTSLNTVILGLLSEGLGRRHAPVVHETPQPTVVDGGRAEQRDQHIEVGEGDA